MLYTPRPRDCSVAYKKFYELKNGDKIYNIDYKTLDILFLTVDNVKVKDVDEYERRNCKEVEFVIPEFDEYKPFRISDGNVYLTTLYDTHKYFITTDKRIAEVVVDIMRCRNGYQWSCFTSIFGEPLSGYAHKDIVIR